MRGSSVVYQHGQAAERRFRELNQPANLRFVCHVGPAEGCASAGLFDEADGLVAAVFPDVGNDNGSFTGRETSGDGASAT
jgi:hypothetical protein